MRDRNGSWLLAWQTWQTALILESRFLPCVLLQSRLTLSGHHQVGTVVGHRLRYRPRLIIMNASPTTATIINVLLLIPPKLPLPIGVTKLPCAPPPVFP